VTGCGRSGLERATECYPSTPQAKSKKIFVANHPIGPQIGKVTIQAVTISKVTPQRTAENLLVGRPRVDGMSGAQGDAESSCKLYGKSCCGFSRKSVGRFSLVNRSCIVLTIRHRPTAVPTPMVMAQSTITLRGSEITLQHFFKRFGPGKSVLCGFLEEIKKCFLMRAKLNMKPIFLGKQRNLLNSSKKPLSRCR
jgi:hypothetical protein